MQRAGARAPPVQARRVNTASCSRASAARAALPGALASTPTTRRPLRHGTTGGSARRRRDLVKCQSRLGREARSVRGGAVAHGRRPPPRTARPPPPAAARRRDAATPKRSERDGQRPPSF